MHLRLRVALACLLTSCGAPTASAEWIIAAYTGAAHTTLSDVTLSPSGKAAVVFEDVRYRGESWQSPIYYGYRVGWFRSRTARIGLEAEVIHLKVFAEVDRVYVTSGAGTVPAGPMSNTVQRLSMSHGLNLLLANLVVRHRVDTAGRVQVVARGGVGPTLPHGESEIGGTFREQYQWSAPALQAGVGLLEHITDLIAVTGEYKLTRAVPAIDVAGGTAEIPALSHHAAFGLSLTPGR